MNEDLREGFRSPLTEDLREGFRSPETRLLTKEGQATKGGHHVLTWQQFREPWEGLLFEEGLIDLGKGLLLEEKAK